MRQSARRYFETKQTGAQSLQRSIAPGTPLARSVKAADTGSVIYINNRRPTTQERAFSILERQFEVVSVLGAGAFGCTYEVVDRLRGRRRFALKRTLTHFSQSLQEAKTLLELDSPCVVAVYGCWKEQNALFVQTELGGLSL